jgi:regulator of replication initiation timing
MLTLTSKGLVAAVLAGGLLAGPAPVRAAEGDGGADVEALRKELAAERTRANLLDDQKNVLLGQVKQLRDEVEATRKTVAALKEQAVRLQLENESCKKEVVALAQQIEAHRINREPAVATRIKAVEVGEQATMVTLEAGADVHVEPDCGFLVHRGGEYIGKVRVLKVDRTSSVGVLIDGRKPLQAGDRVGTLRALMGGAKSRPPDPPAVAPGPAPEVQRQKPEEF